ncbi:MAG: MOP flippase family protein [Acidobacteriota bacterium]
MNNLKKKVISGLGWSSTSRIFQYIFNFIITIVLIRLIDPSEFGVFAMAVVLIGFASLFSEIGFNEALIQKKDITGVQLNSIFWLNLIIAFTITVILVLTAPLISIFYKENILKEIIVIISINFLILPFQSIQTVLLKKNLEFKKISIIEIITMLVSGFFALALAVLNFKIWALVAQSIVSSLTRVILIRKFSSWRVEFKFDLKSIKILFKFSSNLFGFKLFNYFARNMDNILIGKYLGANSLGIYSKAYSIMLFPITKLGGIISQVLFPALSSIQSDLKRVKKIYLQITRGIAILTFPLIIGIITISDKLIPLLFGEKWIDIIPVLQILCIGGLAQSIGTTMGIIYTSQGRTDIMMKWGIFSGTVRVIAIIIGLRWGIIGVSSLYVLSGYLFLFYPGWKIVGKIINMKFTEMMKNLFPAFLSSIIMGIAVFSLGLLLPDSLNDFTRLFIEVLFGIILYVFIISAFKLKAYLEIKDIVISKLKNKKKKYLK